MRLIDIDELRAESIMIDNHFYIREIDIECAPEVDAVEVVHGHWIICSDGYYPYCSKCKQEPDGKNMTNYCPNCGAKMDEEATE